MSKSIDTYWTKAGDNTATEQEELEQIQYLIKFGHPYKMFVNVHRVPCEKRQMIGKSWWKEVGYNTPCSCAIEAGVMKGWTIKNMNDYKYSVDFE